MHYLTVHDLVWINNLITGETVPFDFAVLEQVMAAQYGYGDSTNVAPQAANLLDVALHGGAFAYGNIRTAYVAVSTFLLANGYGMKVRDEEASGIVRRCALRQIDPEDAITELAEPGSGGLRPGATLRALVTHLCGEHAAALEQLAEGDD